MLNKNFIAVEIARHCPNPNAQSQLMINDIPLILWQMPLLAEEAFTSPLGVIDATSRLAASATSTLLDGGVAVARGTLVRKSCGPLLSRYVALCVARRFADADAQRDFIRSEAEPIFCRKFRTLLADCTSYEEEEIKDDLSVYTLSKALNGYEARLLVDGQATGAAMTVEVIRLGRVLFA